MYGFHQPAELTSRNKSNVLLTPTSNDYNCLILHNLLTQNI